MFKLICQSRMDSRGWIAAVECLLSNTAKGLDSIHLNLKRTSAPKDGDRGQQLNLVPSSIR